MVGIVARGILSLGDWIVEKGGVFGGGVLKTRGGWFLGVGLDWIGLDRVSYLYL